MLFISYHCLLTCHETTVATHQAWCDVITIHFSEKASLLIFYICSETIQCLDHLKVQYPFVYILRYIFKYLFCFLLQNGEQFLRRFVFETGYFNREKIIDECHQCKPNNIYLCLSKLNRERTNKSNLHAIKP